MSDAERVLQDEDRLPWLEPVEDEDHRGGGAGALVVALVAALVALGLVIGGVFWLRDRGQAGAGGGDGELIAAPAGPYKEKPTDAGGMKVEGQGDAAFAASAGADVDAAIDIGAMPEAPVTGAGSVKDTDSAAIVEPTPVPTVAPAAAAPSATAGATPAVRTGGVVQLGAFSSAASANAAWKAMAARFAYLKPLTSSVTPVTTGGGTMYRLRATAGSDARTVCGKLKVAGETCAVVSN
jgi:hypothetical protein